jgi:subtilisin family serine protease
MPDFPAIAPVDAPRQFGTPQLGLALAEVDVLIRASAARTTFDVDGSGVAAAVLDTGLNTGHVDFAGRVLAQRNFTGDNGGDSDDATDGQGHGTNVGGIVCANRDHRGVAPGAGIVPLKVLSNSGSGSFSAVDDALQWVLDNREAHTITACCLSLGDGSNRTVDDDLELDPIRNRIRELREVGVATVIASGNDFFTHDSEQGMAYPAILRECISVGAVYDNFEGGFRYASGAEAFSSAPDRITPFSQRLHRDAGADCCTDILAPGAPVTSSGIDGPRGESVQQGTSQATPVTVGAVLLMQQLHLRLTGRLPAVDELIDWMQRGGVEINDGDDERDNVRHTGLDFIRLDAFGALDALQRHLQKEMLLTGQPLKP